MSQRAPFAWGKIALYAALLLCAFHALLGRNGLLARLAEDDQPPAQTKTEEKVPRPPRQKTSQVHRAIVERKGKPVPIAPTLVRSLYEQVLSVAHSETDSVRMGDDLYPFYRWIHFDGVGDIWIQMNEEEKLSVTMFFQNPKHVPGDERDVIFIHTDIYGEIRLSKCIELVDFFWVEELEGSHYTCPWSEEISVDSEMVEAWTPLAQRFLLAALS